MENTSNLDLIEPWPVVDENMDRNIREDGPAQSSEGTPLLHAMDPATHKSTDVLVKQEGSKFMQYIAAISATLGAFALGTSLAWTSPADIPLKNGTYIGYEIGAEDVSWIGALMPLGAACIAFPIGFMMDMFGRKVSMLVLVVPFTVGWALLIWPNGLEMLMAGRFILGMAGGAFAVAAPTYTSEIAEDSVRGALGSYFQLMVTLGILFVYALGAGTSLFILTIICGVVPLVFAATFFFMPETPIYYLTKNKNDEASKALQFFRGKQYTVDTELDEIRDRVANARKNKVAFFKSFNSKAAKKGIFIALGLMLIQQFSGINAVIFNTSSIFEAANTGLDSNISAIIVGVVQVVVTFLSTLVVDRLGRRILLLLSSSIMCVCSLLLGVYFYLSEHNGADSVSDITWLPLVSLCVYIALFSLGFGPIPWMIIGELFPPQIKGAASALAACFNWVLAFLVTKFFQNLADAVGTGVTFFMFMAVLAVGTVFVFFVVMETKGKSLEQIQQELEE